MLQYVASFVKHVPLTLDQYHHTLTIHQIQTNLNNRHRSHINQPRSTITTRQYQPTQLNRPSLSSSTNMLSGQRKISRSSALVLFGLSVIGLGHSVTGSDRGIARIIGGVPLERGELPFLAAYFFGKPGEGQAFWCGASIIDERHILIAAHCIDSKEPFAVKLGCHEKTNCAVEMAVEHHLIHGEYSSKKISGYDIAIIRTKDKIQFANRNGAGSIGPIELPSEHNKDAYKAGDLLTVAGWGCITPPGPPVRTNVPMKVNVTVQGPLECKDNNPWLEFSDDRFICAGSREKKSCKGDSGGPLFETDPETKWRTLVGIVTGGGPGCKGNGSYFTRVSYFLDWIEDFRRNSTDATM